MPAYLQRLSEIDRFVVPSDIYWHLHSWCTNASNDLNVSGTLVLLAHILRTRYVRGYYACICNVAQRIDIRTQVRCSIYRLQYNSRWLIWISHRFPRSNPLYRIINRSGPPQRILNSAITLARFERKFWKTRDELATRERYPMICRRSLSLACHAKCSNRCPTCAGRTS